jgi:hypothetical protein
MEPENLRCDGVRRHVECSVCLSWKKKSLMTITKSYITDETGAITSVILDYHTYKKIEEFLLDQGLLKAMQEVEDEETFDYEEVKTLIQEL